MPNPDKIIYSINIEDVQNVAKQEFDRELSEKELKIVEDNIGDYIAWDIAIEMTIRNEVLSCGKNLNETSNVA